MTSEFYEFLKQLKNTKITGSETVTFTVELNPTPSAVSREQGTSVCVISDARAF